MNASAFAEAEGHPLNAMLTITWRETPLFSEDSWSTLQTRLLDQLSRHLNRRGVGTAFVWTRERVPGMGAHTHVLLHLGAKPKEVKPAVLHYLRQTFIFSRDGVNISMGKFGANTRASRAGLLCYVMKGLDHAAFRYMGSGHESALSVRLVRTDGKLRRR